MNGSIGSALAIVLLALCPAPNAAAEAFTRTLEFSDFTWEIRRSDGLEGPGPNRFLDNRRTVWLDDEANLHLRIWSRLGTWFSAEVVLTRSLGYGTYIFETVGNLAAMDPPVILGIFTYDHDPEYEHREIDIEYGLFGAESGPNAQFVLQPFAVPGNRLQFNATPEGTHLTHLFAWKEGEIDFATYHGHRAEELLTGGMESISEDLTLERWTFRGAVPPPGSERVHINLWLYQGKDPGRDHEVVVSSFSFVPRLR